MLVDENVEGVPPWNVRLAYFLMSPCLLYGVFVGRLCRTDVHVGVGDGVNDLVRENMAMRQAIKTMAEIDMMVKQHVASQHYASQNAHPQPAPDPNPPSDKES